MANGNNRTQGLTAKSATIIFVAYFFAQLLCVALPEAISGASLRPLEEFLYPIVGFVVMVCMAFRLMPEDIKKNGPTGAAWTPGNWGNLVKGLGIGCVIGVGTYLWDGMSPSRGLAKVSEAKLEAAVADFDMAIELNPTNSDYYYNRGLARVSEAKLDEAVLDFDMAIQLNRTNSMYYNGRGWAEFLKGDFNSSIADATRSIQLNPNDGYGYGTRGWARYMAGDVSGAVEDCKRSTQLFKPGSALFLYDQGLLDFIAKDYKKAIADWQSAIEQEPDFKNELQPWIEKAQKIAETETGQP